MLSIFPRLLLFLYAYIFASTEILSFFKLISRIYILPLDILFIVCLFYFHRQQINHLLSSINLKSKLYYIIFLLFALTFIQGFFSAPSTTDSMVYHIPKVMYWIQEKTLFQDVVRNSHDFMAPFGEYVILHLYLITNNDRLLFFSQWLAYVSCTILGVLIVKKFLNNKINEIYVAILAATLPIALLQSSSTQTDLITTLFVLLSTYYAFCFKQTPNLKNSLALGLSLGLGILTKASFVIYIIIPAGIILLSIINHRKNPFPLLKLFLLAGLIILLLQLRFISQNLSLFGSFSGQPILEEGSGYTNELISPQILLSNIIRNSFLNIPIPIFSSNIENLIYAFHQTIGLNANDPRITYSGTSFKILPIIYPQEDIAANPLHFLLIIIAVIYLIIQRNQPKNLNLKTLFIMSLTSFLLFSLILKWQPYHPRLQIPFLLITSIASFVILENSPKLKPFLRSLLLLSVILGFVLVIFNVSRSYVSYSLFYNLVSNYSIQNSSIPESIFIKSREDQYFNARFYWQKPYKQVAEGLKQSHKSEVTLNLMDEFEYPLWILFKNEGIDPKIIPQSSTSDKTAIITTSEEPFEREGYTTTCLKTQIDYGYACLSIK